MAQRLNSYRFGVGKLAKEASLSGPWPFVQADQGLEPGLARILLGDAQDSV